MRRQVMDAVVPQPGDVVLDKSRASFFDYTELDPLLHNLGAQRLVVAGLQTNVCVEATARAALARNFEVAVPSDAVSTDGPALHEGALNSLRVLYTEVAPWRELLASGAAWGRAFTTPDYGRDSFVIGWRSDRRMRLSCGRIPRERGVAIGLVYFGRKIGPTRVRGTTAELRAAPRRAGDQPRVGGDNDYTVGELFLLTGPAPRVRGRPEQLRPDQRIPGTSPARAGTTLADLQLYHLKSVSRSLCC